MCPGAAIRVAEYLPRLSHEACPLILNCEPPPSISKPARFGEHGRARPRSPIPLVKIQAMPNLAGTISGLAMPQIPDMAGVRTVSAGGHATPGTYGFAAGLNETPTCLRAMSDICSATRPPLNERDFGRASHGKGRPRLVPLPALTAWRLTLRAPAIRIRSRCVS